MRYDTKLALDRAYNELKAKRKQNKAFVSGADELIKKIDNEIYLLDIDSHDNIYKNL